MVFQQRNGRVDRYGQAQEPQIVYLFTATQVEKISGDLRSLEILAQKDEQAALNLGDPAAFLNVYDPDKEVEKAEERPGLFKGKYHFATAALTQIAPARDWLQWTTNDAHQGLTITAPPDLQERLQQLPREVRSSDQRHELCADPARVKQTSEQAFVLLGLIPNRKGQPLLVDWQVVCRLPGQPYTLEPYETFAQRAGLAAGCLPNLGVNSPLQDLQAVLPEAVACMRQHMVCRQAAFAGEMQQRLRGTLADLERLQNEQIRQLELRLQKQLEQVRRGHFEHRSQVIRRVFDEYRQWVEETLSTEPEPYP